jgi:hypothetical protein
MNLFVSSDTRFAIFETLLVFFDRQHRLRIHQKINTAALCGTAEGSYDCGLMFMVRESARLSVGANRRKPIFA